MVTVFSTLFILVISIFHTPATARGTKNWIGNMIPKIDKFSWEGCADVKPADFTQTKLVDFARHKVRQPVDMCFIKTSDVPNFYFIQKLTGQVRYYDDATGEVQDVGDVRFELHNGGVEDGLNGITLDYDFETNRWIYLFYSVEGFYRVARFKVSADNKMLQETKQVLLDAPKKDGQWHASGKMDFDVYGNLWISIGDNLQGYRDKVYISMATADLRGSWLRIHPTEEKQANGKYYTIPKNNFGEYWAEKFEAQGKSDAAAEYRNPELVLPEIFSKGVRNSWGLKVVEPFTPFVASGECGPDPPKPEGFTEQTNVVSKPGFHGWPLHMGIVDWNFYAPQIKTLPGGVVYDSLAPRIEDNDEIKGARLLPPIVTPVYKWEYRRHASPEKSLSCGTGAAVYWYDGYSKSKKKFPPHFNGKLFATDNDAEWIRIVTLNKTMDTALSESEFFDPNKQIAYTRPLDVSFGPDGALYIVHWAGSRFKDNPKQHISRIEYKGDCLPDTVLTPYRGCMDPKASNYDERVRNGCPDKVCCEYKSSVDAPDKKTLFNIGFQEARLTVFIKETGPHLFRIFNVNGELIDLKRGQAAKSYHYANLQMGLYFIKLNVGNREYTKSALVVF